MSTGQGNYQTLKIEERARIAHVTLNRPEKRNAFDPLMVEELRDAFVRFSARTDISVISLRGEGATFSAGADLSYMQAMANFTVSENQADARKLDEMFWALRMCPQPIVGRIHGHAMGGALGLTALCDIVGAVEDTQFCFSEVKLGLAPAVISPYVLEKMQASQAKRYMLSGEVFSALDALQSGLIHFVGDVDAVDSFVEKILHALCANGPEAMRETKKLLRQVESTEDWTARRNLTTATIAARRVSAEGQEGLRGFLEKRAPSWKAK